MTYIINLYLRLCRSSKYIIISIEQSSIHWFFPIIFVWWVRCFKKKNNNNNKPLRCIQNDYSVGIRVYSFFRYYYYYYYILMVLFFLFYTWVLLLWHVLTVKPDESLVFVHISVFISLARVLSTAASSSQHVCIKLLQLTFA